MMNLTTFISIVTNMFYAALISLFFIITVLIVAVIILSLYELFADA